MKSTYHMLGYIRESPQALRKTLDAAETRVAEIASAVSRASIDRVVITGIGSSYTASLMAAPLWTWHSRASVHIVESSEFGSLPERILNARTMVIAVSRSGERGLVVEALKRAVASGAYGVSVTGCEDSLLARQSSVTLPTAEGPEITFPKTKSVVACAGLLMRLALQMSPAGDALAAKRLAELRKVPGLMERAIEAIEPRLNELMPELTRHELVAIAGTGSNYGAAMEGAMKLQEASFVPTCGNSTDGLINGPVGALDRRWLLVALVTAADQKLNEQLLRIAHGFGAHSMTVSESGLKLAVPPTFELALPHPSDPFLAALLCLAPLQLLAYSWTVARGMNPDAPASMQPILDAILPPGRKEPELGRN